MNEELEPVREDEAGLRVDVFLVRRLDGVGRAAAKALLEKGSVRVDGKRVRKGQRLAAGAKVALEHAPHRRDFAAVADEALALTVVYEDDDLVVLDKPAGVPSHPLEASERGTVANMLAARYPELSGFGHSQREAGLVHRLDIGTSGLLVAARNEAAFKSLVASLRAGKWEKRYLALAFGRITSRIAIDAAIGPHPSDPRKVVVASDPMAAASLGAKTARTDVTPVEAWVDATLVEASASAAKRHQIRAHLAFVGHPLLGDALYGGPEEPGLARHFLHASTISLPHPTTGATLTLESKLPSELEAVLVARRATRTARER